MLSVLPQHNFLSSSGSLTFLMTTICFMEQVPPSVWILRFLVIVHGLKCLGRHMQLIKVDVDPGSKRTFSSVHDLTEDIVSTMAMLVEVRRFLFGCWGITIQQKETNNGQMIIWYM
jgi:hypothetical protein